MENNIRNFCIIAHIDHGKSTLADRLIEVTGSVEKREMKEQLLDQMDLERERGITIKLAPVTMVWRPQISNDKLQISNKISNPKIPNNETPSTSYQLPATSFVLNLIDTPGHVDFSYEVSRSLAAVEGAILLVDASQGIEAQTLSTLYAAIEHDLTIIPVLNKIDLPAARPHEVKKEIVSLLGCKEEEILEVSAKTGEGVIELLQSIVKNIPAPKKEESDETRALIFDSIFDSYRGVVSYVRVFSGQIKKNDDLLLMQTKSSCRAEEVGTLNPKMTPHSPLFEGEIGYVVTGFKEVSEAQVGDTITLKNAQAVSPLPGYKKVTPYVYASIFCSDGSDYPELKDAIEKLKLNDSSLFYESERSDMLGFGFRCGFLGLLHLDIIRERLEREFDLDLVITSPTVIYKIVDNKGNEREVEKASDFEQRQGETLKEPWAKIEVIAPKEYIGSIMDLSQQKRGVYTNTEYMENDRAILHYQIPLAELIVDYYDKLKSISKGYASLNYEMADYKEADLNRVDILIAEERIDALSFVIHKSKSQTEGRRIVEKLKELIPKQNFEVKLQAAIGGRVIASSRISPLRKDVTAGLYGGDVTRKNKLLDKQKKGKKRLKQMGKVQIPSDVFIKVLKD